jgi:hypothetical protein
MMSTGRSSVKRCALLVAVLVLVGCTPQAGRSPVPASDRPAPTVASPVSQETPPVSATPKPPQAPLPTPSAELGARFAGEDLELTGLGDVRSITWSPSGRTAVVAAHAGWYLLDTEEPSLKPLPAFKPMETPAFWSESDLLWLNEGRLQLRNLTTGEDRLLHDFGAPVIHFVRPDDTRYIANREQGRVQQGYRFGTIVAGALGGQDETVLLETGHLIGRMAGGQVLAVEGPRAGPVWALTPTGEKRLLSEATAYFVQVSPDGSQALWLTGSPEKSTWLDLFRPATAYADPPYDPPLADLWTWNGNGDPVRVPLGGVFSARAQFSPDGSYIALALNEDVMTEVPPDPAAAAKPGNLAVVIGNEIRPLATFEGRVGLGMWLGSDGFQFAPPAEKTGGQAPIFRIDLTGVQAQFSGGIWYQAGNPDERSLIVNWKGDVTTVHWSDSAREARVDFDPNQHLGHPVYVPPSAPYLPFVSGERVVLRPVVSR